MASRLRATATSWLMRASKGPKRRAVPPDTRASTTSVAPVDLRPILEEARRIGLDPRPLFRGLGFSASDLDIPGFMVTHAEATALIRRALLLIDNPRLGIELGMRSQITDLGALALGLMASKTLGDAIALSLQFPRSAGFLLSVREDRSDRQHALVAESMFGNHDQTPFLVDKLFAGMVRQRRQVTGADYAPAMVELVRPRPANAKAYEHHFRSPVRFGSLGNRLVSDIAWLSCPLPMANRMSLRLSCDLLEREAAQAQNMSPIGLTVERAIRKSLPKVPTPAEVAASLNLSERTLRRKLADERLSYRTLLDAGRKSRALELVVNGRQSLSDVAAETGFADARTLRRAFRRWTGQAPSDMRNEPTGTNDDAA